MFPFVLAAMMSFANGASASLLFNGDFELGNTGFLSQYTYAYSPTGAEGHYVVAANTRALHPGATEYGDHSSGTGQMLSANGATAGNRYVWSQEVSLVGGKTYQFSGWATSWGHFGDGIDVDPARLALFVDDTRVDKEFVVEKTNGRWTMFQFEFESGLATNVNLKLFNLNTAGAPNDFSIDDLSLRLKAEPFQVPEPSSFALIALAFASIGTVLRRNSALYQKSKS